MSDLARDLQRLLDEKQDECDDLYSEISAKVSARDFTIQELKATVAALTAENERLRENEHTLRMGWWLSHGCSGLYGDDGEMQCGQCMIDFKRDDPRDIETRIKNANMLKLASQLVEAKEHG